MHFKCTCGLTVVIFLWHFADLWDIHYNDVIMIVMGSPINSFTIVYSIIYSDADQSKHQSSVSLAFGDQWIPPTKGKQCGKCLHLMTSTWIQRYLSLISTEYCDKPISKYDEFIVSIKSQWMTWLIQTMDIMNTMFSLVSMYFSWWLNLDEKHCLKNPIWSAVGIDNHRLVILCTLNTSRKVSQANYWYVMSYILS